VLFSEPYIYATPLHLLSRTLRSRAESSLSRIRNAYAGSRKWTSQNPTSVLKNPLDGRFPPLISYQAHYSSGVSSPMLGSYQLNADFFNSVLWSGKRHPEAILMRYCQD
jgi:hypothetical protein